MPYKYENGKWTYVAGTDSDNTRPSTNTEKPPEQTKPSDNDNRETTNTQEKAGKEYIEVENNILEGTVLVDPNPKYKAKTTIKLSGIGKQLTGLYFVDKVTHIFDSNGYSQELTVSREGFGDSIKKGQVSKPSTQNVATSNRPQPLPPKENPEYIPINKWGTVTPSIGLNVRTGPSMNHKILGAMTRGTRVYCLGKKGDWYDHKYGGQTAWSHGDYIKLD